MFKLNRLFLTAVAVSAAALAGAGVIPAPPASASAVPVAMENCGNGTRQCATFKPHKLFLLRGGPNVWLSRAHWSHWSRTSARATGTLWGADITLTRIGSVTVILHDPVTSHGVRYFEKLHVIGGRDVVHYWYWSWDQHNWS